MLLYLPPISGNSYMNKTRLGHFYLKIIVFILLLNFIYLFVLGLAVASFGIWSMQGWICWTCSCNVDRYIGKVVELLALYYLFLFAGRVAICSYLQNYLSIGALA